MIWGKGDKKDDDGVAHVRDEPRPDFSKQHITREKLPQQLQQLVDRDDDYYDELSVDTTETPYRYAGYANRIRTLLLSAHRYVAYTSDIGESFRPVAHPWLVRGAYAVSWTYILGDVAHEGYKAYLRNRRVLIPPGEAYRDATDLGAQQIIRGMATGNIGGSLTSNHSSKSEGDGESDPLVPWPTTRIPLIEDYRMVIAKRAVFQSIASMALPAFTIHSVVKYSGRALKEAKSSLVRTWLPIGLGLAVVPLLPYAFDEPVEQAVEWSFHTLCRGIGGEEAVTPALPPSETPANKEMPLSSLLKLQSQKKRLEEPSEEKRDTPLTWEEYKEEKRRAREQRKKEREASGIGGWFGFGKKEKDE
ncbi:hypothetical protein T310_3860 [Rasamsonia emersonii CBS 393.64]|uniref:Mitochondrial fission process protein 1 n=1 Tax=Rasamsonia emersonii (strain ATCC 16479 / CBS 393.64 / IMI 116815) TaxID=1408163 RepID=A0A0F4YVK6_RASE3|nr:hypothetical protein T310_3860 [Rasamsonia emersonii CBS 393.64]KKA22120.1 hypothetical protein T310_3860 [Rasamsonia emersonii CBS 393.64]